MKLYKLRLIMHYTNSHSYQGGYPDVYIVAENKEEAHKKAYSNYKEKNKVIYRVLTTSEITEPVFI